MKKNSLLTTIIVMVLVMAGSVCAWCATAGFELTVSDFSIRLNSEGTSLVPIDVNGNAQVNGVAGSPREQVPAYLAQKRYGTYNLSSSYHGGPWLQEMTTSGVYDPITNSANIYDKIVSNAPGPGPDNIPLWGSERAFVVQWAGSDFNLTFSSPQDGWYQTHITADYSYTGSLDNSGPNTFAELNWAPELVIGINPPYSIYPNNFFITDIFENRDLETHTGHLDLDIGPEVYLFAGDSLGVNIFADIFTQSWGPTPSSVVPLPSPILLFSTGILWMAGWRFKRNLTGR